MTFGLALFICVFLVILGMVVASEYKSRKSSTDGVVAGLDTDSKD